MEAHTAPYSAITPEGVEDALQGAILGQEAVVMGYLKPQAVAPEPRGFEPVEIKTNRNGDPYVVGWDYGRGEPRNFRLDRVAYVTRDPVFGDARNMAPASAY